MSKKQRQYQPPQSALALWSAVTHATQFATGLLAVGFYYENQETFAGYVAAAAGIVVITDAVLRFAKLHSGRA